MNTMGWPDAICFMTFIVCGAIVAVVWIIKKM